MMSLDGTANAAAKVRTFAAALAVPSKLITVSYPSLQTGSQCPKNVVYRMCPSHANLVSKKTIVRVRASWQAYVRSFGIVVSII